MISVITIPICGQCTDCDVDLREENDGFFGVRMARSPLVCSLTTLTLRFVCSLILWIGRVLRRLRQARTRTTCISARSTVQLVRSPPKRTFTFQPFVLLLALCSVSRSMIPTITNLKLFFFVIYPPLTPLLTIYDVECTQCYGWKKQITRLRAAAKKAGRK